MNTLAAIDVQLVEPFGLINYGNSKNNIRTMERNNEFHL